MRDGIHWVVEGKGKVGDAVERWRFAAVCRDMGDGGRTRGRAVHEAGSDETTHA